MDVFLNGNFSMSRSGIKRIGHSAGQRLKWLIHSAKIKSLKSDHTSKNQHQPKGRQLIRRSENQVNA